MKDKVRPTDEEAKKARDVLLEYLDDPDYSNAEEMGQQEIAWLILKNLDCL